eukprot:scaffold1883_cov261-Pinguiococcus_pyrenoidosus.AAC.26
MPRRPVSSRFGGKATAALGEYVGEEDGDHDGRCRESCLSPASLRPRRVRAAHAHLGRAPRGRQGRRGADGRLEGWGWRRLAGRSFVRGLLGDDLGRSGRGLQRGHGARNAAGVVGRPAGRVGRRHDGSLLKGQSRGQGDGAELKRPAGLELHRAR